MALHLYRSNRLEILATVLSSLLRASPPDDPFAAVRVVVGSGGMARWLRHRLAEDLGVCANVLFPFPAATLDGAVRALLPDTPRSDPWSVDSLSWSVLAELVEMPEHPLFAWLQPYLPEDGVVTPRLWGVARELANVFDRYITYRPELARAWSEGRFLPVDLLLPSGDLSWQPVLWSRVAARIASPHRAQRAAEAMHALQQGQVPPGYEHIRLFGVSSLPPAWLELLAELSQRAEVELYLLCPSSEYWGDLRRKVHDSDIVWHDLDREGFPAATEAHKAAGNPLLAALGRQAREFQVILENLPDQYTEEQRGIDAFPDPYPGAPTVLHRLQSDILAAAAPEGTGLPHPLASDDRSVQLHACYGPTRQVEAVRDALLALLAHDPSLHPRDILVMTPDIETYAPLVSAVFHRGQRYRQAPSQGDPTGWGPAGAPALPFEIADLSVRRRNPVADALLRVLGLVSDRVRASTVLDLLALDCVRSRFDLSEDDLPRVREWVTDSGIRWGLDASHRAQHGLPEDGQNTWDFGLTRVLLGACMPDDEALVHGALPFDPIEGGDARTAGRMVHFVRTLAAELRQLQAPRPVADWAADLRQTVERLTVVNEDDAWHRLAVLQSIDTLAAEAASAGQPRVCSVRVLFTALRERFDRASAQSREQSGAVTVTAMAPMRSVPYRVVVLLGMDDGALPRSATPSPFDLTQHHWRLGDRSLRDEDRYLFLEALLAARDHLLVSWTARDVHSNEEQPCATPLAELLDVLDRTVAVADGKPRDALTTFHPLQAHSRDNFGHQQAPRSFDRDLLAGAVAASGAQSAPPPFFQGGVRAPTQARAEPIELDELIRFFERPSEHLLRRRLTVNLREQGELLADREPIELGGLENYGIFDRVVSARLHNRPTEGLPALLAAQGVVPLGYAGTHAAAQWTASVDAALDSLGLVSADGQVTAPDPAWPIRYDIGGDLLIGSVDRCWGPHLIDLRFGSEKGRYWMRPWIQLLALRAMGHPVERAILVENVKKGGNLLGLETPADAEAHLQRLVALYREGCEHPLPLFADTSFTLVKALKPDPSDLLAVLDDEDAVFKALGAARKSWSGPLGDAEDPHVRKLYGTPDAPPGGEHFLRASLYALGPVPALRQTNRTVSKWVSA